MNANQLIDHKALILTSSSSYTGIVKNINELTGAGSVKMHMIPAYDAASELKFNPKVISLNTDKPSILNQIENPSLCIISKINTYDQNAFEGFAMATLAAVARLKARECKIICLYCDHLASMNDVRGKFYKDILKLSNNIVVTCKGMSDLVKPFIGNESALTIIEDPWQTKEQEFKAYKTGETLKIAWFGNTLNITYLAKIIPSLINGTKTSISYELKILGTSSTLEHINKIFQKSASQKHNWCIDLNLWDNYNQPNQLEKFLGDAHIVLIPSDPLDKLKAGVSHNRMVDAVRSGCIVLASPMQSYLELREIGLIGSDLPGLLNEAPSHINRLGEKYAKRRGDLLSKYDPLENKKKWITLLK